MNGQCAQQSSQLTDVEYRLVRVIGSILGLGWSQVNVNVQAGSPSPTSNDYAGFPVMHATDSWYCVPITACYPNPYQLSMDDAASISRLYPVTAQNQSSFPGKQIFSATTARIHGSVWFTDTHGNRTQAMQGVNVVARWIDPSTGLPSRKYAAASVSGFLFTGNAGNPITGFSDALGDPLGEWGSNNQSMEGFYDLAGLQLPNGGSAQYQLSVEALDPRWSTGVGPYTPGQVSPSGTAKTINVTVTAGSDSQQDILMNGAAQPIVRASSSWTAPATLPSGGDWVSSLNGYGDIEYFQLAAQSNRTLSVAVTAFDDSGHSSNLKAEPVIGMWAAADPEGTAPPAFTPSPFNQLANGMTRLDAQVVTSSKFLIGISDMRGDGRPDYHYHAHVLYADRVYPSRVSTNGGNVTVSGTGFAPGLTSTVGTAAASPLSVNANQMILAAPSHADGVQDVTITDPIGGSSTTMTGALTFGAASSDNIVMINPRTSPTPVGAQTIAPLAVQVLAADGVTPVSGATVGWSGTNSLQISACGGASSCSVATDQNGEATTWLTPATNAAATITATLAPGVYSPPKSVSTTQAATESSSDIGLTAPYIWISQGATASLPLTVRILSNGVPQNNSQANFSVVAGSGSLSAASAKTGSNGYATVTLSVTQIATFAQVSVCVSPANTVCGSFYVSPVPLAQQHLQPVSGAGQISTGAAFQPVVVRVIDSSTPPNVVVASPVLFQTTVFRPGGTAPGSGGGETNSGNSGMPVILKVSQNTIPSDGNGLASFVPSAGGFAAPVDVDVNVSVGTAALDNLLLTLPAI